MRINNAMKALDKDTLDELAASSKEDLKERIVKANQAIEEAEIALEANPEYQLVKETMAHVTAATKELRKRQKAIITVAFANMNITQ